jgi:hypothetical protein
MTMKYRMIALLIAGAAPFTAKSSPANRHGRQSAEVGRLTSALA